MDEEVRNCLSEVICHLWDDERKVWQAIGAPENRTHIFCCLRALKVWLESVDAHL